MLPRLAKISALLLLSATAAARADNRPTMPPADSAPSSQPSTLGAPATQPAAPTLSVSFASADHRSGIYYAKEEATFSLFVENPTNDPADLTGNIAFGLTPVSSTTPFKPISITPISPTAVAAHQRAELNISATFAAPGNYELRWADHPIAMPAGLALRCIFPPRPADAPSRFIARLPAAAALPGFLADYSTRTGISRFVMDDPWPRAEGTTSLREKLTNSSDFSTKLEQIAAAKVNVVVRIGISDTTIPTALHDHIAQFLAHTSAVEALVLQPPANLRPNDREHLISCYIAAYDAAKKHDKNLQMLGLGSAQLTESLLFHKSSGDKDLLSYVDAIATTFESGELARLRAGTALWQNRPLWLLPPLEDSELHISTALALAEDLHVVPVPDDDRGATLQLFSGAVLFERVYHDLPYSINVLQNDGYAVATLCGPGAGSPNDAQWPGLQALDSKTFATTLEVADEAGALRVVDEAGYEVDCHSAPDVLQIPLGKRVLYLLQTGSAQDLVAALRAAPLRHFPLAEARGQLVPGPTSHLKLTLRNATPQELAGKFRILIVAQATGQAGAKPSPDNTDLSDFVTVLQSFAPIPVGKSAEFDLPLSASGRPLDHFALEIYNAGTTQRLPVLLEKDGAAATTGP